ncbi:macrophage-capping protein-like [Rhincodon typus]|uniref:macrophage-capping protein-like n=1 Tax=Rhincodon typus TaxID=259920 RepID=UPI002030C621|nr:macrophage-capping protein-like [Rhincodon typus]
MGMESSFEKASEQEGLQIWKVEKMKLVSVPTSEHGTFFTGDAYLVLHRQDDSTHLHIWHGSGHCRRGDQCNPRPSHQHLVCSLKNPHLNKQNLPEGGVESGFQKVPSGPALVRRLYHVKGKRNVRAKQVDMSWSSFNTGDCFILDLGQNIYQWCGSLSNMYEKQKAGEFASSIRDVERRGKAQVIFVSDGEEPEEMTEVRPRETGSERGAMGAKGRGANSEERRAALKVAEDVISQRNYPSNTQVEIIPEGLETAFFKQFFKGWN